MRRQGDAGQRLCPEQVRRPVVSVRQWLLGRPLDRSGCVQRRTPAVTWRLRGRRASSARRDQRCRGSRRGEPRLVPIPAGFRPHVRIPDGYRTGVRGRSAGYAWYSDCCGLRSAITHILGDAAMETTDLTTKILQNIRDDITKLEARLEGKIDK